jgi:hypothetical protein
VFIGLPPAPSATTTPGLRVKGKGHICPSRKPCLKLLALRFAELLRRACSLGTACHCSCGSGASGRQRCPLSRIRHSPSLHGPPPLRAALSPTHQPPPRSATAPFRGPFRSSPPHSRAPRCSFVVARARIRPSPPLPILSGSPLMIWPPPSAVHAIAVTSRPGSGPTTKVCRSSAGKWTTCKQPPAISYRPRPGTCTAVGVPAERTRACHRTKPAHIGSYTSDREVFFPILNRYYHEYFCEQGAYPSTNSTVLLTAGLFDGEYTI